MNRDHISLADALAFDSFTPEQKRIAYAGLVLGERIESEREEARREGYDAGMAAGRAEALREDAIMSEQESRHLATLLREIEERAIVMRMTIAPADSRYEEASELIARVTRTIAYVEGDR